jgi:ABC-2 type transport system permease protein
MSDATAATRPTLPAVGPLLLTQIRYQTRLLLANGRAVVIGIGLPILLLISSTRHSHASASDVAGRAVFGLTLIAWNTYGVRTVAAREAGILKRWRATPVPRSCYFLARILATVLVSVLAGAATVAAAVALYGTHLSGVGALATLAVFILGAAAWAGPATALTSVVATVDTAGSLFLLVYLPIVIVSGVLGSISEPHWLHTIATYLPAEPLAHAATSALRHSAGMTLLPARDLLVLAAWAVVGLAVAVATFRWEPHRARQHRAARAEV